MLRRIGRATPGIELLAARSFAAQHVRPGAAQARVLDRLMRVDGDLVSGSGLGHELFVPHAILAGKPFVAHGTVFERTLDRAVVTHIAGLDRSDALRGVERERIFELTLVVLDCAGSLMMSDQSDSVLARIRRELRQIEVRTGLREAEVAAVGDPVSVPAEIPAFHEYADEPIARGEIDISPDIVIRRAVALAASPRGAVEVHLPPHTDVLADLDPGRIGQPTGLVEIELDPRICEPHRRVGDENHAPRRRERAGLAHEHAIRPRHQIGL